MNIQVRIEDKIAQVVGGPVIICGNSDYEITFTLDDEWAGVIEKTARFCWERNGENQYTDVNFKGNTVAVPILVDLTEVRVGLYAGELHTTTPARIVCQRSILCDEGVRMLKGDTGDAATVDVGEVITGEPGTAVEVTNVGTKHAAVFDFKIPAGDTGPQGKAGNTGPQGQKGDAATVAVGTVETVSPESPAKVTNVGTPNDAVLNFEIPAGRYLKDSPVIEAEEVDLDPDAVGQCVTNMNEILAGTKPVPKANNATNATNATNAGQVNGLAITRDSNGVLKIGDTIIPQKVLLYSGTAYELFNPITTTYMHNSLMQVDNIRIGDHIEIEYYFKDCGKKYIKMIVSGQATSSLDKVEIYNSSGNVELSAFAESDVYIDEYHQYTSGLWLRSQSDSIKIYITKVYKIIE